MPNRVCAQRTSPCAEPGTVRMKSSLRVALCACFASFIVGITVAADDPQSTVTQKILRPKPAALVPTVPVTPAVIQRGGQVYRENCAVCHGEDGRADTPAARALPSRPADQTNPQIMEVFED